tara:strand:- start:266 stop:817 length:552 start_codon:yes stop_codon:yes gene_type:complete
MKKIIKIISSYIKNTFSNNSGMTLPEVLVSAVLLASFTSLYIVVVEFTNRFYLDKNSKEKQGLSFVVQRHQLNMVMDELVDIISQPGYNVEDISNMNCQYPPEPPDRIWGLIGEQEHKTPENYRLCVFPTNLEESLYSELIKRDNENIAKPGIYIIFAIPDKITHKSLPVRRLFCRPKVFCNS